MPHPYLVGARRPRVFAHRGFVSADAAGRGIAENTREAFAAAAETGAEYLESDCHLSRDGKLVLFHDDDLTRVTGDPRKVSEVTHSELASIMRDRGGLLTLGEALEDFPLARFNIDVKAAAAAELAGRSVAHHGDRVLLTSFSDRTRARALRSAAAVPGGRRPATSPGRGGLARIVAASATGSRALAARLLRGVDALQIPETHRSVRVFTPRLLAAAHANDVEVHVWTINDPERMQWLVARGADGIITDRTDLALAELS